MTRPAWRNPGNDDEVEGLNVQLRELMLGVISNYDRSLPSDPAQDLLKMAPDVISPHLPAGYSVRSRYGMGNRAAVPLIAILDNYETTTTRGLYVVYHFSADLERASISLAQGVDSLHEARGETKGREQLKTNALRIRKMLQTDGSAGLATEIDLRSDLPRPRSYEASVIYACNYPATQIPPEATLLEDLGRFIRLYKEARLAEPPRLGKPN